MYGRNLSSSLKLTGQTLNQFTLPETYSDKQNLN